MMLDSMICIAAGFSAYFLSLELFDDVLVMGWNDVIFCILLAMFMNNFLMAKFGFYTEKRFRSYASMVWFVFVVVVLNMILLSAASIIIDIKPFSRGFISFYFLFLLVAYLIIRFALYYYLDNRALTDINCRQILMIGDKDRLSTLIGALDKQPSWGHRVAGYININGMPAQDVLDVKALGNLDDFEKIIHEMQIDEIIFSIPRDFSIDLQRYINKCREMGMTFRIVPGLYDMEHQSLRVESLQNIPTLALYSSMVNASGLFYKKIVDIVFGSVGFIIFLIMLPFIALAIKLDSKGPVFFKQERVGMNNRRFMLYKFRTMVEDADKIKKELLAKSEMNGPIFKMENDPRTTRAGKFLRKTSLDEFPQFINVLKGEMSIVGTRPPTPDEVAGYKDWHRRRISMKPGITGLWQVSGRNKIIDFDKIVELDLTYIDNWRFHRDILIIFRTIWVVLLRKGAK
jgi:exopolysaccharide biosynthesis polyprenyl glycosylphosphotransferase